MGSGNARLDRRHDCRGALYVIEDIYIKANTGDPQVNMAHNGYFDDWVGKEVNLPVLQLRRKRQWNIVHCRQPRSLAEKLKIRGGKPLSFLHKHLLNPCGD